MRLSNNNWGKKRVITEIHYCQGQKKCVKLFDPVYERTNRLKIVVILFELRLKGKIFVKGPRY